MVLAALYLLILYRYFVLHEWGNDARSYWTGWEVGLYERPWHGPDGAYVYSPAFAQGIWPLTLLPWPAFFAIWTLLEIAVLVALAGPILAAVLLLAAQPIWQEVAGGNVDLMIGAAIAVGFRYPSVWAFPMLTKVTPGVGLIWFAVRREWRPLWIALGVTAAIVAVSATIAPGLWADWVRLLIDSSATPAPITSYVVLPLPLAPRLALGGAIVVWAAATNRPWAVVVAAVVASPLVTSTRLTMLLGALPLLGWGPLRMTAADARHQDHLAPSRRGIEGGRRRQWVGRLLEATGGRADVGRVAADRKGSSRVVGADGSVVTTRSG